MTMIQTRALHVDDAFVRGWPKVHARHTKRNPWDVSPERSVDRRHVQRQCMDNRDNNGVNDAAHQGMYVISTGPRGMSIAFNVVHCCKHKHARATPFFILASFGNNKNAICGVAIFRHSIRWCATPPPPSAIRTHTPSMQGDDNGDNGVNDVYDNFDPDTSNLPTLGVIRASHRAFMQAQIDRAWNRVEEQIGEWVRDEPIAGGLHIRLCGYTYKAKVHKAVIRALLRTYDWPHWSVRIYPLDTGRARWIKVEPGEEAVEQHFTTEGRRAEYLIRIHEDTYEV